MKLLCLSSTEYLQIKNEYHIQKNIYVLDLDRNPISDGFTLKKG